MTEKITSILRQEALDYRKHPPSEGRVVRVEPAWADRTYRVLVGCVLALLVYVSVGTINEYATGPSVVRIDGRVELTAPVSGTIREVLARPGQRIKRGEPLVRFYLAEEEAELTRMEQEHDALILHLLHDPHDHAASITLSTLAAQRDLAGARLEQKTVLAPSDGVVADVRIRSGQAVEPGDALLTVIAAEARGRLIALLPAHYRPMLRHGQTIRLELTGYRFVYTELLIESVSEEAIGPNEARRFLGPERGDAIALEGPVVVVEALLPSLSFYVSGEELSYYDGMVGVADARVRTENILLTLIPGLKELLRRPA